MTVPSAAVDERRTGEVGREGGRGAALALSALVCWLLASGRWGSYVGIPRTTVYLTDLVLLAVSVVALVRARQLVAAWRTALRSPAGVALVVLLGWSVVRLVLGGVPNAVGLRDFAPYLYAATALLATALGARLRVGVLTGVLAAHSAWVLVTLVGWGPTSIALGPTAVFALRNDFDSGVCGIAVIWCVIRLSDAATRARQAGYAVLLLVSAYLVMNLENRAALIATLVALAPVMLRHVRLLAGTPAGRRRLVLLGGSAAVLLLVGLVFTSTGARLVSTVTGSEQATGSISARSAVYESITSYVTDEPGRLGFGVGFGPDFMHITGADARYEGTEYTGVRAPHNFALNTVARLGLIGLAAQLVLVVAVGVLAWRSLSRGDARTPAQTLAAVTVLLVPVLAAFGVILESPFGAVPYYWAVGIVLAWTRTTSPTATPDGVWPRWGGLRASRTASAGHRR